MVIATFSIRKMTISKIVIGKMLERASAPR